MNNAVNFDSLETRVPADRETDLFQRLPELLDHAKAHCPGHAERLTQISTSTINTRDALSSLPVLRKPELQLAQQNNPPFGGFADLSGIEAGAGTRMFMSPGPVWEPQAPGSDPWQVARAMHAAGIRPGDKVHNAFSYHTTPGGFIMDQGAIALGCLVFPAGVGGTDAQVEAAHFYQPDVYAGTPDYLKVLLDRADEMNMPLSSIKTGMVSGGALFPTLRDEYLSRGIRVMQCYATADLGVIAYETTVNGEIVPGMICNENLIVEIVRSGTDTPVKAGEVGELVVTCFNKSYPLIRFGTGDLSAVIDEPSPCGRTNLRIKGWMGRADQRTKIKGMFVDPKQIDELAQSQSGIRRARLVVTREGDADKMTLQIEADHPDAVDTPALANDMQRILKLKGEVVIANESFPNDGLVIADERDYQN